jgi:hypothetical protein
MTKPYSLELNFYRNSREETLVSNNAQNYFDRVAISSMQFVFHAKDFHIGDRSHHYKRQYGWLYRGATLMSGDPKPTY